MYPREAIKTLKNIGDIENQYFNHNKEMKEIKTIVDKQINDLKQNYNFTKINSYARIYTINEIKNCLIKDICVPISIPVYKDIELDKTNIIQINKDKEISGYHMMLIYGWNELGFLIQNSWGKDWGDNGTAILPYEYPIDSAWAISTENKPIDIYEPLKQKIITKIKEILHALKILLFYGKEEEK